MPYAPIKFGSAYYKKPMSEEAFPVYVESIIVRNIQNPEPVFTPASVHTSERVRALLSSTRT